ncbi:flavin monoamine oxidase family protein [Flavicella marina]|uniref:flavin monoamine oxidase family protein n=1 Tax=Flavicella marina TaxID=1475951 RepID=UPI0012645A37|nr:FAD-dependent oxidoreductase [Flavicella marina]
MVKKYKYIIVGAGLSGLVTAYKLLQNGEEDFIVLESRSRVGGRIFTNNHIDLGATWLQNSHTELLQLLQELNVHTFEQYSKGKSVLVYSSMSPAHYFEMDTSQPSSKRIVGGTKALLDGLYNKVKEKIVLNEEVVAMHDQGDSVLLETKNLKLKGEKVVCTLPPLLASEVTYVPNLPDRLIEVMKGTHTWMSNAIKVGIQFKTPFWREKGLSGTIIGQASPLVELYDHTNFASDIFVLKGFVNESLRELSPELRKIKIINFLEKYFGKEIRNYIRYQEKDWSQDMFTSVAQLKSYYLSPQYGNPIFQKLFFESKLLFSGTETSDFFGGYLEGAVRSGINAFKILSNEIS